jgi:P27 family predicted phage terminase small subunit
MAFAKFRFLEDGVGVRYRGFFLMGRVPKPTAIRILEGNREHRPFNDREPTPLTGAPLMPKHLDATASREWRRLVPTLLAMHVLSESDGLALGNLCMTYSRLVKAEILLSKADSKKSGTPLLMKVGRNGYVQQAAILSVIHSEMATLTVLLREFGVTPASRSRIVTTGDAAGGIDPLELKLC